LVYDKFVTITLEEARTALGETGKKMSDEEVLNAMALMDSMADNILDKYERMIYEGRTIKELHNGIAPHLDDDQLRSQKKFEEFFKEWKAKHKSTERKSDKIKP